MEGCSLEQHLTLILRWAYISGLAEFRLKNWLHWVISKRKANKNSPNLMKDTILMFQVILTNLRLMSQDKIMSKTINKTNHMANQTRTIKHRPLTITITGINMLLMICIHKWRWIKEDKMKPKIINMKSQKMIKNLILVKMIRISIRKIKMKMIQSYQIIRRMILWQVRKMMFLTIICFRSLVKQIICRTYPILKCKAQLMLPSWIIQQSQR